MKPDDAKVLTKDMSKLATDNRGKIVRRAVLNIEVGSVEVEAKANSIGFVYWRYDRRPVPRKHLQALLERPEITEVL